MNEKDPMWSGVEAKRVNEDAIWLDFFDRVFLGLSGETLSCWGYPRRGEYLTIIY